MTSRKPADGGLSGLGLVMQLGGAIFGAFTALFGLSQLIVAADVEGHGSEKMWMFVLTGVGVVRSMVHRTAGGELLYGSNARGWIRNYLGVAAAHTALWLYYASSKLHGNDEALMSIALLFGAWPLTIGAALLFGGIELPDDGPVPLPRDKGFDGLGCLMTVLGVGGLLYGLVTTAAMVEMAKGHRGKLEFQVLMVILIMLIIRSSLHVRAAVRTLTSRDLDHSTEAASRYGNVGVTTAVIAGVLMMVFAAKAGGPMLIAVLSCGAVTAMLLAWPMAVRRFVTDRRFAGRDDPSMRTQQSTDGGMSSLGWLLLALGVMALASALPAFLWPESRMRGLGGLTMFSSHGDAPKLQLLSAAIQIWAGIELIAAKERARLVAILYGVVASAITVYVNLPLLKHLDRLAESFADPGGATAFATLALALVVPGTTLLLAIRNPPPIGPDLGRVFD